MHRISLGKSPPTMIDVQKKTLDVNFDSRRNGTFAEIGAGQEPS